ncbi:unnamed protein product [Gordionus sp. m RMFG-2023]
MARAIQPGQQKIAEKLIILNNRGNGLLTRLYNIKKTCNDPKSKPPYLTDKSLEPCLKLISKKFPAIDVKGNMNTFAPLIAVKNEVLRNLDQYYYTFVDYLEFKDHVTELLTNIDALQINFDITTCYDLTVAYLDLTTLYISLTYLLFSIPDRHRIVGLYHSARSAPLDPTFHRLGHALQRLTEGGSATQGSGSSESASAPLPALRDQLRPHARRLLSACFRSGLAELFTRRNLTANEWRNAGMLGVTNMGTSYAPAQTDTMHCEYLSLEKMERWIVLIGLVCHPTLVTFSNFSGETGADSSVGSNANGMASLLAGKEGETNSNPSFNDAWEVWKAALRNNVVVTIFRDESINIYAAVLNYFETIKGYAKRIAEIKECYIVTIQETVKIRRERRKYLRVALKELISVFNDQHGLLGPKALYVYMALSFTRDELRYLVRHQDFAGKFFNSSQSYNVGHCSNIALFCSSNVHHGCSGNSNSTNSSLNNLNKRLCKEEFEDRTVPELLFYMEELKGLVIKYRLVLRRYYIQYLSGYDAIEFKHLTQNLSFCQEEESLILTSFHDTLLNLNADQTLQSASPDSEDLTQTGSQQSGAELLDKAGITDGCYPQLRALRLDWMRLQAYGGMVNKVSSFTLADHPSLAKHLNTITFHSKLVDDLFDFHAFYHSNTCPSKAASNSSNNTVNGPSGGSNGRPSNFKNFEMPLLLQCSEMSLFCFYPGVLEDYFKSGLEFPPQMRFIIAFPRICSHFIYACHDMCPEEKPLIGDRSLMMANSFLEDIAKEIRTIVAYVCEDYCLMNDQTLPKHAIHLYNSALNVKRGNPSVNSSTHGRKNKSKSTKSTNEGAIDGANNVNANVLGEANNGLNMPGFESYRRYREELNVLDIQYTALTELCTTINHYGTLKICNHAFTPREYVTQQLELYFNKSIVAMAMYNVESNTDVARPSEVLVRVRTCISLLFHTIENFVNMDMAKLVKIILLQQTQPVDNQGDKTITSIYTMWYLEVFLKKMTVAPFFYSDFYKCTLANKSSKKCNENIHFSTDEYIDIRELRCLAELLTPYGMKHLSEQLMRHVANQTMELRKIVLANKDRLVTLRTNFDDKAKLKDFNKKMNSS